MDPQDAIDSGPECTVVHAGHQLTGADCGTGVGLSIGLLQAVTQIQEQSVTFVPKLIAMVSVLTLAAPWLINQMVQYSKDLITNIPSTL